MYPSITQAQSQPSTYAQRATLSEIEKLVLPQPWFDCLEHQPTRARNIRHAMEAKHDTIQKRLILSLTCCAASSEHEVVKLTYSPLHRRSRRPSLASS